MEHIRQKIDSSLVTNDSITYTVVNTTGWTMPLSQHPSIIEHPEVFEIVDVDIPSHAQYLNYTS